MSGSLKQVSTLAMALVLGLAPVAAAADFKQDYGRGKKAFEDGDYSEAIRRLEEAIADEATAQERVRIYGMRFEAYLPHYYLGAARYAAGDCAGAVQAWQESLNQGLVRGQPQFADLQTNMAACESQVVDVSAIAQAAESELDELESAIGQFEQLSDEPLLSQQWSSNLSGIAQQARGTLGDLRTRLAAAVDATDADAIEAITGEAQRTAASVGQSNASALAQADSIRQQQQAQAADARNRARRDLVQAIAAARGEERVDGNNQVNQAWQTLSDLAQRGESLGDSASVANQQQVAQDINSALRRYRQTVQEFQINQQQIAQRTPPAGLKQVAEAYFSGDYAQTAQLADPAQFSQEREKIQALLFRAAANHRLYVLSGEQQQQSLSSARQDISAIKQLDPNFSPYIAAFSPRFLNLFNQGS